MSYEVSIAPADNWFYLHAPTRGEPARLSRVTFWKIERDKDRPPRMSGVLNLSTDNLGSLAEGLSSGGAYLHKDDFTEAHLRLLADLRARTSPAPMAAARPSLTLAPMAAAVGAN